MESFIRAIHLEMITHIVCEVLLSFQLLNRLTTNLVIFMKGLDKCRFRVNLVLRGETLGDALWLMS